MTDLITHACGLLRGTWISRPNGKLSPIENLRIGDKITTLDHGPMPITGIELYDAPAGRADAVLDLCPWIYTPDQSVDDALYLRGDQLILWTHPDCTDTLITARDLARCRPDQCRRRDAYPADTTWYRLHLEGHQIIVADGYTVGSARRDPEFALCRDLVSEVPAWA